MEDDQIHQDAPFRSWTLLGALFCFIIIVPMYFLGSIAVIIWYWFEGRYLSMSIIPYWEEIHLFYFPSVIRGVAAGAGSMYITKRVFRNAHFGSMAYGAAFGWAALISLVLILNVSVFGMSWNLGSAIIEGIVLVVSLYIVGHED